MRFSTTVISLMSLVLGTNALLDPGYTRTWDLTIGGRGRWRGAIEVQLENGQVRTPRDYSPFNNSDYE